VNIVALLPLLVSLVVYSAIAKLAAKVFRRSKISWRACALFSLGAFLASALGAVVFSATGIHRGIAIPLGILLHIAFSAWFFSRFARTADGEALNPIASVKLAATSFGLAVTLFGGLWLVGIFLQRAIS